MSHCEKPFLAPGFATSKNDDDDWLSLDNDASANATSAAVSPSADLPTADFADNGDDILIDDVEVIDDGEPGVLSKFGDQLSEFTSQVEPLPSSGSSSSGAADPNDPFGDLPPLSDVVSKPSAKKRAANRPSSSPDPVDLSDIDAEFLLPDLPASATVPPEQVLPDVFDHDDAKETVAAPRADDVQFAEEYRVKCNICGSILYAKARQAGKTIKCTDCHSAVKVPPPPKIKQKPKVDMENAKTFSFEQSPAQTKKRPDPYSKSAQEMLDEAERSESETTTEYIDPDIPSLREWAMNVFGIFLDFGVIAHWLGLTVLGAIPAVIAVSVGHPMLLIGLSMYGLLFATLTIACGFAIMQSVANKHESISDWPEANPTAWIDDLIVAVSAVAVAGLPVLALTGFAFGPGLLSTAMTMFAIYLLFPFFVLSMMDMQSVLMPFSPEVARSVTRCQEAWGALYLSSGLLFFGLFLTFVVLSSAAPAAASVFFVALSVAVAFCYFSAIGRLAYSIAKASTNLRTKTPTKALMIKPRATTKRPANSESLDLAAANLGSICTLRKRPDAL